MNENLEFTGNAEDFTKIVEKPNGKFTIVVGNRIATPKEFDNEEGAEEYRKSPKWDLVATLCMLIAEQEAEERVKKTKQ